MWKCGHKMREVIEGGEVDGPDGRRNSDGRQSENALSKLGEERERLFPMPNVCGTEQTIFQSLFKLFRRGIAERFFLTPKFSSHLNGFVKAP